MPPLKDDAATAVADDASAPADDDTRDPFEGFADRSKQITKSFEQQDDDPQDVQDTDVQDTDDQIDDQQDAQDDAQDTDDQQDVQVSEEDVLNAFREQTAQPQPAPESLQSLQSQVTQILNFLQNGGQLPAQQQAAQQPQQDRLTPEQYEAMFDPDSGPEAMENYISSRVEAGVKQALQQATPGMQEKMLQDVMPTIDKQIMYRDFFAKNADINPEDESTQVAATIIAARHPAATEAEKLTLMGELIRQTREQARDIKNSKTHRTRISRTSAPARTGTRETRPKAPLSQEEQALMEVQKRMNAAFIEKD